MQRVYSSRSQTPLCLVEFAASPSVDVWMFDSDTEQGVGLLWVCQRVVAPLKSLPVLRECGDGTCTEVAQA